MLIYRALNDTDIKLNCEEYGLYSKANVNEAIEESLNFLCWAENRCLTKEEYKNIKNEFRSGNLWPFMNKIIEISNEKNNKLQNLIINLHDALENKNYDAISLYATKLFEITTTRNAHVLHGSRGDFEWISFSKSMEVFKKYYLSQDKHMGVCMESNINIILDNNLLAYDMSSKDVIENNPFVYNKSNEPGSYMKTDMNSTVINYSINDKEVLYYNHIPRNRLMFIKPLQVDLLYNGMLNPLYFEAGKGTREILDHTIKFYLRYKLKEMDPIYQIIFDELFEYNNSIEVISKKLNLDYQYVLSIKEEILNILNDNPKEKYLVGHTNNKVKAIERI